MNLDVEELMFPASTEDDFDSVPMSKVIFGNKIISFMHLKVDNTCILSLKGSPLKGCEILKNV